METKNVEMEILKRIKEDVPYDESLGLSELEVDNILLTAIKLLIENPKHVKFDDSKFICEEDASFEIKFYVDYRNKKYHYWKEVNLGITKRDVNYMNDEEWDEWHRGKEIEKCGANILTIEGNKNLMYLEDEYYSCELEAPYEVYFYAESKNVTTYFSKEVFPRIKIERIKEARIKAGYSFYEDYTPEDLAKLPSVDPNLIIELTEKHGFNPLVWNGKYWISCYEVYK